MVGGRGWRARAVVPYAEAQTGKPLEISVYRGADGAFDLYDDAGDGPGHQKGEHVTISFTWNDSRGELTIGAQQGSYAKAPTSREFRIMSVDEQHGTGIGESAMVDRTLTYTGAAVTVPTR